MEEVKVWSPINGYEGIYIINRYGSIYNIIKKRTIAQSTDKDGYLFVRLRKDKKDKPFKVHRLVAIHFISNPENKPTVNHKFGNKKDNFYLNLEWATSREQNIHAHANGLTNHKTLHQLQHFRSVAHWIFKPITAFSYQTHQKLWTAPSIAEACRKHGLCKRCVTQVLAGKKKYRSHKGMYFKPS